MLIPLIESLVYACASGVARTPKRSRQVHQAPRRILNGQAADLLIDQLRIERSRVARLQVRNADLERLAAADHHELVELRGQLAAASRLFRAHGLA